ncbi:hypothetical protein THRCLA_05707 [Thraustotheca clavata]|uniref:Uncharacterized protein n=1 Tax=Thraustotheca clavata TaxID=74557 RepID=A0A1V9ZVM0_9STRA|nr:hypothetical protein THRCLA_05707 [Thraustotheca clavata]
MGNLIVGGAVSAGVCSLSNQVSWLSVHGPMQGSLSANLLENKCNSNSWTDIALKEAAALVGFCPAPAAYLSLKTQATVDATTKAKYLQAQAVRQKYATKTMCGVDAFGLNTVYSPIMYAVGQMANFPTSENDGMVDFPSCSVGLSNFGTDCLGTGNYKASINHADATFRNGDGWWGSDRKPVKWLQCAL